MDTVAVLGSGSWGTAFATIVADAGAQVRLWGRRAEQVERINTAHENSDYLPGIKLAPSIVATTDPAEALDGAEIVVVALPSQKMRTTMTQWSNLVPSDAVLVSLMKGIERGTGLRMSQVISQVGGFEAERIAVVSGPNLAGEIAARQPSASVVASVSAATAEMVADACATPFFRPYTDEDIVGVELGGATKNVIAVAVGVAEGMGLGDNTKATIVTRGLAETVRLGMALGAEAATFSGLAGVGDLIATCMSPLSRNHRVGVGLGQGMSLDEVVEKTGQTAEGVASSLSILQLGAQLGVEMPITEAVVAVVHDGQRSQLMGDVLMSRVRKSEKPEQLRRS
ncbi:NAD(P)H-dependent glycerol-3-phosphate dehydrogenase [Dermatophilus congolensis]|uniref:NAD(P)H-dependent glycerol-3-phosphate dehydrogenase n=1 Tax=Dermatophilus congolensis TaxID=1863 RepID=UPI001AAE7E01|nr:NAD(P)-dependent glycerol-3-phosphate dehydrogenase [Dermatophilus congolensis]MBO3132565.1 NAD(P)-dependent glycerol-3-phosphate dehydrogenase [Dermatophilus congolensis]MBO3133276.1 NAD(P)-dependent glycerol-3-phosphate dehydrogenase [Dermatophilus congolensis]MBO3135510.1 NAD(P)-dependent glycerol-3-phosphate dehydrogenase [Dermatophilus congolensis]MBO3137748.1 NAD(P)-dependent glycerol-3-phosphate dehydrogenase [Dermatophilus congolensis]